MKRIISFIIILIPIIVNSQITDSIKPKSIAIGVSYSPDLCYRIIKTNSSNEWLKNQFDTLEIAKIGFTTGLNLDYKLNNRFSLSSGILYSNKGEKLKQKVIPTIEKSIDQIYYLDIPLKLNYSITTNTTSFFVSAGISTNLFVTNKITIQKENSSAREELNGNSELSKVNFASILNLGINQEITKSWYFKTELLYRQSINPIMKSDLNRYLYSFGLNLGFYHFIK